ncbi:MAG: cation-translocating P-type ATPase [Bacillota bacterium]
MMYHLKEADAVLRELESAKSGIDSATAAARLEKYGPNKLAEGKKKTVLQRFIEQLIDPMVIILLAAALISGVVKEIADSIIIMAVVVVNSILGVAQEGKAEKAIEALRKMSSPYSKVRRGGRLMRVRSEEIVPGDIVLLEAGDAVPADMRLIEASSLKIEEASLTGESVPVEKSSRVMTAGRQDISYGRHDMSAGPGTPAETSMPAETGVSAGPGTSAETGVSAEPGTPGELGASGGRETPVMPDIPLGDRINMAYMGTNVVYGRGEGVVVHTGMSTEMGKIAGIISGAGDEKTPLQKALAALSRVLSICVIGISVFIFVFSVLRNGGFSGGYVLDMFLLAVSLAVAAIPEGLVPVVTVVLSIGVTRMSRRNAIIRRLTAVETLGCTQVICSDKTGTLTQNKMTVVDTFGDARELAVSMALCNDAGFSDDKGTVIGEPTESALVRHSYEQGFHKAELEKEMPRVAEAPFDSIRKMMSTIHNDPGGNFVQYTKGAPDEVLKKCTHMLASGEVVPLTDELRAKILGENRRMAGKALRVLGSAMKRMDEMPGDISPENLEKDMVFIGLAGMLDPVRPEVKAAIETCREAGIKPIMITGDHRDTAVAIAGELGIITDESQVITGVELSQMTDEEYAEKCGQYYVYARVQPEHKVRIVNAWKEKGFVTAMTGDGVNDAPALKSADIGVGMGITGTDVSKNVSDMVLADDNFATIVTAVEEGRRIYDNIRKAIQFLLSSNLSEVIALFTATIMNFRLFAPIHILWINLVTDMFPAIALGMEAPEPDIMQKPPRSREEGIFAGGMAAGIIFGAFIIAVLTLVSYFIGNKASHATGTTMAFLTMAVCEIFQSLNLRSRTVSIFRLNTRNDYLIGAMVLSVVLTIAVIYIPGVNAAFGLEPLASGKLITSVGLALLVIPFVELFKLVYSFAGKQTSDENKL